MERAAFYASLCSITLALGLVGIGCGDDEAGGPDVSDSGAGQGEIGASGAGAGGEGGESGGGAGGASDGESGGASGGGSGQGEAPDGGGAGDTGAAGEGEVPDGGGAGEMDAGSDPESPIVAAEDVCDRLSTIQCSGEARCCDFPGRDYATCKQVMQQACENDLNLDQIAMSSVSGYNEYKAGIAFAEFESLVADCVPSVVDWAISRDGFAGVVEGTIDEGESCAPPDPLTATIVEIGAALVSCQDGANVACLPAAAGWTCQPRVEVGGTCFTDTNCKDGLYCVNPTVGYDGVCAEKKAVNEACAVKNECQSFVCSLGVCAPVNQQNAYCLLQL
jgi:hypothetical protein